MPPSAPAARFAADDPFAVEVLVPLAPASAARFAEDAPLLAVTLLPFPEAPPDDVGCPPMLATEVGALTEAVTLFHHETECGDAKLRNMAACATPDEAVGWLSKVPCQVCFAPKRALLVTGCDKRAAGCVRRSANASGYDADVCLGRAHCHLTSRVGQGGTSREVEGLQPRGRVVPVESKGWLCRQRLPLHCFCVCR